MKSEMEALEEAFLIGEWSPLAAMWQFLNFRPAVLENSTNKVRSKRRQQGKEMNHYHQIVNSTKKGQK